MGEIESFAVRRCDAEVSRARQEQRGGKGDK